MIKLSDNNVKDSKLFKFSDLSLFTCIVFVLLFIVFTVMWLTILSILREYFIGIMMLTMTIGSFFAEVWMVKNL